MDNRPEGDSLQPRRRSTRRRWLFVGIILTAIFAIQEVVFRWMFPVPEVLFNRADYMPPWFSGEISQTRKKALCNVIARWECEPDGVSFDQIVLSSSRFLTAAPGPEKFDATILSKSQ